MRADCRAEAARRARRRALPALPCCVVLALLAAPVAACPPPPLPGIEEQAAGFWKAATEICIVRLFAATLAATDMPAVRRYALANGYWEVQSLTWRAVKGSCDPGTVYFADMPYELCGGGMPPFDVDLLVAMTYERVLTRWVAPDSELGAAVSRLAERIGR